PPIAGLPVQSGPVAAAPVAWLLLTLTCERNSVPPLSKMPPPHTCPLTLAPVPCWIVRLVADTNWLAPTLSGGLAAEPDTAVQGVPVPPPSRAGGFEDWAPR